MASLISPGPEDKVKGVFSTTVMATIGFGHTKRKKEQQIMVFAEELDDGRISLQAINSSFVPTGEIQHITKEQLLKNYVPEPQIYMAKVYPAIREVTRTVAKADRHYKHNQLFSAEYEYKNALRIAEENIRATFGLGLTYLDRGEKDRGDMVFRRLVKLDAAFEKKHKHLFNDFGIKLRKNGMFSQAMKFYARAYKFGKDDEHLLYNMARTMYDKGSYDPALSIARKALELRPDFDLAKQLVLIVEKRKSRKKRTKPLMTGF